MATPTALGVGDFSPGHSAVGTLGESDTGRHASQLHDKLERVVLPLYYGERTRWIWMMKQAISRIGPAFNPVRDAPLRQRAIFPSRTRRALDYGARGLSGRNSFLVALIQRNFFICIRI